MIRLLPVILIAAATASACSGPAENVKDGEEVERRIRSAQTTLAEVQAETDQREAQTIEQVAAAAAEVQVSRDFMAESEAESANAKQATADARTIMRSIPTVADDPTEASNRALAAAEATRAAVAFGANAAEYLRAADEHAERAQVILPGIVDNVPSLIPRIADTMDQLRSAAIVNRRIIDRNRQVTDAIDTANYVADVLSGGRAPRIPGGREGDAGQLQQQPQSPTKRFPSPSDVTNPQPPAEDGSTEEWLLYLLMAAGGAGVLRGGQAALRSRRANRPSRGSEPTPVAIKRELQKYQAAKQAENERRDAEQNVDLVLQRWNVEPLTTGDRPPRVDPGGNGQASTT